MVGVVGPPPPRLLREVKTVGLIKTSEQLEEYVEPLCFVIYCSGDNCKQFVTNGDKQRTAGLAAIVFGWVVRDGEPYCRSCQAAMKEGEDGE